MEMEKKNGKYNINSDYNCIDAYKTLESEYKKYPRLDYLNPENWLTCPFCGLKPKVWIFDNGRSTACGCWNSKFDHFSIHAESIMSKHKRKTDMSDHGQDFMNNWNHWCKTGEELFLHAGQREDGRW